MVTLDTEYEMAIKGLHTLILIAEFIAMLDFRKIAE